MEWKSLIEVEIQKGFSKSTIEKLAGLSKNNLASALSGKRELSKIGKIKIERWLASEKPDPLTLIEPKGKKVVAVKSVSKWADKNKVFINKIVNQPLSGDEPKTDNSDVLKEIANIEAETIPKERDTPMGRKVWNGDQNKRIRELKSKLR